MHRVGQQFRRDILKPETPSQHNSPGPSTPHSKSSFEISDDIGPPSTKSKIDDVFNEDRRHEPQHLQMLRAMVEEVGGEEVKKRLEEGGQDDVIRELADEAGALRKTLMERDPEGWETFREAQVKAQRNSVVAPSIDFGEGCADVAGSIREHRPDRNTEDESAIESD